MRALLVGLLRSDTREGLLRSLNGRQNSTTAIPDCTCGDCALCLWQYLGDIENARVASESERAARINAEQTLRALHKLGLESLKKHEITVSVDGKVTENPDLAQILRGFEAFATQAKEQVFALQASDRDARAARRGYADMLDRALKERDEFEAVAKKLNAQTEAVVGILCEALGRDPANEKKLTPLAGALVEQRNAALLSELALRLYMSSLLKGDNLPPVTVKLDSGTTTLDVNQQIAVLREVLKRAKAFGLPGGPAEAVLDAYYASEVVEKEPEETPVETEGQAAPIRVLDHLRATAQPPL